MASEQKEKLIRFYKGTEGEEIVIKLVDLAENILRTQKFRISGFLDPFGQEIQGIKLYLIIIHKTDCKKSGTLRRILERCMQLIPYRVYDHIEFNSVCKLQNFFHVQFIRIKYILIKSFGIIISEMIHFRSDRTSCNFPAYHLTEISDCT